MVYWNRIGDVQAVELDLVDAPYPDLKRALAYWTLTGCGKTGRIGRISVGRC